MRILIVNNESVHAHELFVACRHNGRHSVEKISWQLLPHTDITHFDVLVISGSSSYSVRTRKGVYSYQKKLIKDAKTPIVGICAGFELICDAFQIDLQKSPKRVSKISLLTPIANDPIFESKLEYRVFESHKMFVSHVDEPLIPLALVNDNVAVIKHESMPIYGLQFHPEVRTHGNNGLRLLHSILAQISHIKNTP